MIDEVREYERWLSFVDRLSESAGKVYVWTKSPDGTRNCVMLSDFTDDERPHVVPGRKVYHAKWVAIDDRRRRSRWWASSLKQIPYEISEVLRVIENRKGVHSVVPVERRSGAGAGAGPE